MTTCHRDDRHEREEIERNRIKIALTYAIVKKVCGRDFFSFHFISLPLFGYFLCNVSVESPHHNIIHHHHLTEGNIYFLLAFVFVVSNFLLSLCRTLFSSWAQKNIHDVCLVCVWYYFFWKTQFVSPVSLHASCKRFETLLLLVRVLGKRFNCDSIVTLM